MFCFYIQYVSVPRSFHQSLATQIPCVLVHFQSNCDTEPQHWAAIFSQMVYLCPHGSISFLNMSILKHLKTPSMGFFWLNGSSSTSGSHANINTLKRDETAWGNVEIIESRQMVLGEWKRRPHTEEWQLLIIIKNTSVGYKAIPTVSLWDEKTDIKKVTHGLLEVSRARRRISSWV